MTEELALVSKSTDDNHTSNSELLTTSDLLLRMRHEWSNDPQLTRQQLIKRMGDLGTAANRLCRYLKGTRDNTLISQLLDIDVVRLTAFLRQLGVGHHSITATKVGRNLLLRHAKKFGWSPASFALENEWQPVISAAKYKCGVPSIVRDTIARKRRPKDFSQADLDLWANAKLDAGKREDYVAAAQADFRKIIRDKSLQKLFPLFDPAVRVLPSYRLPLSEMGDSLRDEIAAISQWLRHDSDAQMFWKSELSYLQTVQNFEELCGFANRILKVDPLQSLSQILNKRTIRRYVHWLYKNRGLKRTSIVGRVSRILSVLRRHPSYRDQNFSWILQIFREIPTEAPSALSARRRQRRLQYEDLFVIPWKIGELRSTPGLSPKEEARLAHDQLLMALLVLALWVPSAVIAARVSGPSPNIWEGPVPADGPPFGISEEVRQALAADPQMRVWQFAFEGQDAPRRKSVRGLVLNMVVPLLEEYVQRFRPLLIASPDVQTLLVGPSGQAMDYAQLIMAVGRLTRRFAGKRKRVTPTSIRDSFAHYWLARHHRGYVDLANILWIELPSVLQRYDPDYRKPQHLKNQRAA